ncbi:MAG TPA: hypothetical protein VFO60_07705 [Candidatus Dormibacteraeota bacterium]|nr:hypothetical protein [Candidatus Dormibacteraeota bacterium]
MKRFRHVGLVPCPPAELAAHFLDPATAPGIWPELGQRSVLRTGAGWQEMATAELDGGEGRPVRFRVLQPTEIVLASAGAWAHHSFLPADGGCRWVITHFDHRRPGEGWSAFTRRRLAAAQAVERLVDSAAAYFAARRA